jgi:uncharacterized coiled-coil protein SlyX
MFKKLKERIEYLETSEFQDLRIMWKMTNQINENEKVIEALRENLNLLLDHLKLKLDYTPEQKAKKVLVKKK